MEQWPRIDIHIITMNGVHHLQRLLPSLVKTRYPNYRVFLLDNSSNEDAATYAKSIIPSLVHLDFEKNVGFAKANNDGLKRSIQDGTQFAVLLNDDTEILDGDWLSRAIHVFSSDQNISVVGFKEVTHDEEVHSTSDFTDILCAKGFCMAIRTNVLERCGLFDESYFAYCEETDMQSVMSRLGYRIVRVNSSVFHVVGGSFGRDSFQFTYLMVRNAMRYSIKNDSLLKAVLRPAKIFFECVCPIMILRSPSSLHLRRRLYRHKRAPRNLLIWNMAVLWNIVNLRSAIKYRKSLRKLHSQCDPLSSARSTISTGTSI